MVLISNCPGGGFDSPGGGVGGPGMDITRPQYVGLGPNLEEMNPLTSRSFLYSPGPTKTKRKGEKPRKTKQIIKKHVFRNFSDTFACPDLGIKFLYQFFALNPNLRSKMQNSELQRRKNEINNY